MSNSVFPHVAWHAFVELTTQSESHRDRCSATANTIAFKKTIMFPWRFLFKRNSQGLLCLCLTEVGHTTACMLCACMHGVSSPADVHACKGASGVPNRSYPKWSPRLFLAAKIRPSDLKFKFLGFRFLDGRPIIAANFGPGRPILAPDPILRDTSMPEHAL